jgi:cobalt-zinc-cadmium efflux system outer membrane protein
MRLKRFTCAAGTALLCCLPLLAQNSATGVTADDLVKAALERNQEYLAAQERLREAEALVRQSGLRPAPTVEVEAGTGTVLGSRGESEYSAAFFQPIETGGKRSKRVAIAEKGLALARAEIRDQERQLRFEVKTRFIAAALQELKLEAIRTLRPLNDDNYRLVVRRVELGDAAPLEQQLLLAEMNRIEADQVLMAAAGEAAVSELRASIGLPHSEPVRIVPELGGATLLPPLEMLQESALQQRADIQILQLLQEQANAEAELARAEGRPDVTVSARYTRVNSAFDQSGFSESGAIVPLRDTDNIVTFGVSIPLFTHNRARGATEAAASRQTQQRLRLEHLKTSIPLEVEAAYRRLYGAIRSLEILRTGVIDPSQKSLTIIREAYRLGQLRTLDVLNEQRRLVNLQFSYLDAQAEAARALVELERAVGGPLP